MKKIPHEKLKKEKKNGLKLKPKWLQLTQACLLTNSLTWCVSLSLILWPFCTGMTLTFDLTRDWLLLCSAAVFGKAKYYVAILLCFTLEERKRTDSLVQRLMAHLLLRLLNVILSLIHAVRFSLIMTRLFYHNSTTWVKTQGVNTSISSHVSHFLW